MSPPVRARGSLDRVVTELRAAGCVYAEDEAGLLVSAATTLAELDVLVRRRVSGEPLEQILGWAELAGLRVAVEPGVFVPRRRSALLVQLAVDLGRSARTGAGRPTVVDLCCGSGAVGLAVAVALGTAELHAADLEPAAVRCARRNLAVVAGHIYEGDLYEPLPVGLRGTVDLLVVNAPYVPTAEIALMPAEARLHEPRVALDGGADGLDVQRRVTAGAAHWLAPGGHLLVETSRRQAPSTATLVAAGGLVPRVVRSEELDATVVVGTRDPRRSRRPAHAVADRDRERATATGPTDDGRPTTGRPPTADGQPASSRSVASSGTPSKKASSTWPNTASAGSARRKSVMHERSFCASTEPTTAPSELPSISARTPAQVSRRGPSTGCAR